MRRSLSNCAASKLGILLSMDVHGGTVCAWEHKTVACVLADAISFNKHVIALAMQAGGSVFDDTSAFLVRCDATGASVWQKQKLHALEARASEIVESPPG